MPKPKFLSKRPGKAAALANYVPAHNHRRQKEEGGSHSNGEIAKLKHEIELLTAYATDTIYRLRYDTMHYDYISPAVTRLLGFSPQEMKRINFRELIIQTRIVTDGLKSVETFGDLEMKRKDGDVNKWQADYLMRTKDGRKIWVSDVSYPWFDESGKIIGSIGSLHDITDRVEAEQRIKEELSKIANTDALTGLSNRREFFHELEQELKRLRRVDSDVSIMVLDIDHFKKINDTHGHDVGDAVLIQVTEVIRHCLRETDLPARIGGEEFAILMPDTPVEGAAEAAERIRMSILQHDFKVGSDNHPVAVTVSIGVAAAMIGNELTSSELFKLADTRLYIAKNSGRNQTSVDEILHTH